MELRHRKRINNLPKFAIGVDDINYGTKGAGILNSYTAKNVIYGNIPKTITVPTPGTGKGYGNHIKNSYGSEGYGNIALSLVNHVGAVNDAFTLDRNVGQIEATAGSRNINAGDWSWLKLNDINTSKEIDELRKQNTSDTLATAGSGAALGAAIGSIFPGAGTIIGGAIGAVAGLGLGLLGGSNRKSKLRKRIYNAQQNINRSNNYAFAQALGDYINQDYDLNHAYTQDDLLYVANTGKDLGGKMNRKLPHYDIGKVATQYGWKKGAVNSIVGEGEPIFNLETGFGFVPHMAGGKSGALENIPSNVAEGDSNTVASSKFHYDKLARTAVNSMHEKNKPALRQMQKAEKYADYLQTLSKNTTKMTMEQNKINVKPEIDYLTVLAEAQKTDPRRNGNTNIMHAAKGQDANELGIPGWTRAIPSVAGLFAGWNQLNRWKRLDITAPDTYAANPNEGRALSVLASLHDNPYGLLRQMQDVERRAIANTNGMGGLSGSQRYLSNVASTLGLQRNYADVLRASQAQNNQYKANYASSALQAGEASARRRQDANQFGYNAYTAAHGRKTKGIETGIANIINAMNSAYSNEFKYRMGNKTLNLYQLTLDNERKAIMEGYGKPNVIVNNTTSTAIPDQLPSRIPYVEPQLNSRILPYGLDWTGFNFNMNGSYAPYKRKIKANTKR